jgi:hypothetical protein
MYYSPNILNLNLWFVLRHSITGEAIDFRMADTGVMHHRLFFSSFLIYTDSTSIKADRIDVLLGF